MANIIDSLPAAARTSTTGQGLAGLVAGGAALLAHAHGMSPDACALVATFAGAIILIFFPQATGAPTASQAVATDIRAMAKTFETGLTIGAGLPAAKLPAAPAAPAVPVPPTTQETPHA